VISSGAAKVDEVLSHHHPDNLRTLFHRPPDILPEVYTWWKEATWLWRWRDLKYLTTIV